MIELLTRLRYRNGGRIAWSLGCTGLTSSLDLVDPSVHRAIYSWDVLVRSNRQRFHAGSRWVGFRQALRKFHCDMTITFASVAVALVVGGAERFSLVPQEFDLKKRRSGVP
jgi:high-affinity nickel permease